MYPGEQTALQAWTLCWQKGSWGQGRKFLQTLQRGEKMGLIGENYNGKTVRPKNSALQIKLKDEQRGWAVCLPFGTAHLSDIYECWKLDSRKTIQAHRALKWLNLIAMKMSLCDLLTDVTVLSRFKWLVSDQENVISLPKGDENWVMAISFFIERLFEILPQMQFLFKKKNKKPHSIFWLFINTLSHSEGIYYRNIINKQVWVYLVIWKPSVLN